MRLVKSEIQAALDHMVNDDRPVCVAGDFILDQYIHGYADRISPEAPVPIVVVNKTEDRLGGAGNVLSNISNLKVASMPLCITGVDSPGRTMVAKILDINPNANILQDEELLTLVKTRVLGNGQQVIRIDSENLNVSSLNLRHSSLALALKKFSNELKSSRSLVISDYNKHFMRMGRLCEEMIQHAKAQGVPVIADAKPQNYERLKGVDLLTPNLEELFYFSPHDKHEVTRDRILHACHEIMNILPNTNILCTMSDRGMGYVPYSPSLEEMQMHIYPVHTVDVLDVSGAGDTVASVMAALFDQIGRSLDIHLAIYLAQTAAQVVIQKMGTIPIAYDELMKAAMQGDAGNIRIEEDFA